MSVLSEENQEVDTPALHIKRVEGALRWFDHNKGYGFIMPLDGSPDVLLHNDVLKGFSHIKLKPGTKISCEIIKSSRGLLATKILDILDDMSRNVKQISHKLEVDQRPVARLRLAIVKWYDEQKGYGFAVTHLDKGDVMLSRQILRKCGIRSVVPGDKINVSVSETDRGLLAEYVEYAEE